MKRLPALVILAGICLTCVDRVYSQDAKVHQGMKAYVAQKCSVCHSINGKGNKKLPLDGVGSNLTLDQIREWIVNPKDAAAKAKSEAKPPMKSYSNLPTADVDALVAYMASLRQK